MASRKTAGVQRLAVPVLAATATAVALAIAGGAAPLADAHSLFNSAEQTIGQYRMQVATLPEFPQVGETSQILFRLTDRDLDEVGRFTMGVRIFYDGQRIQTIPPTAIDGGHWQKEYVFETSGNHVFRVDVYDIAEDGGVLTYTFNMSTQSPFGYVFIAAITAGAVVFTVVVGYIYLPGMLGGRRAKSGSS